MKMIALVKERAVINFKRFNECNKLVTLIGSLFCCKESKFWLDAGRFS